MQTLITAAQMRLADEYTIANKPITSAALMEKAAEAFVKCFIVDEPDRTKGIAIFCGKGNNGGDGLAIARLLNNLGYQNIQVFVANFIKGQSADFFTNLQALKETPVLLTEIDEPAEIKTLQSAVIIDALLGSGLNKPLTGDLARLVSWINQQQKKVYAVDVPTGFFADGTFTDDYDGIKAYKTICFQRPKINFFFPESTAATQLFDVMDIGLDEDFIDSQPSVFKLVDRKAIKARLKIRLPFSNKGTYGHALLIAGQQNTMGAAILNAKGCLYAGAGLTTLSIPESGLGTLNTALPEVMYAARTVVLENLNKYNAIAMGSGLGISDAEKMLVESLLLAKKAMVIDADALTILAQHPEFEQRLPLGSILTPHVKEFDRLFGQHKNWHDRLMAARKKAMELKVVIVLKNQYTFIVNTAGLVYINPTGNPAMAQGGMGDVLTGVIAAYLAQGFTPENAAIVGCYIHGLSGDDLAKTRHNVTASQVAKNIPRVVKVLVP